MIAAWEMKISTRKRKKFFHRERAAAVCLWYVKAVAQGGMEWIESQMIIDFRLHTARQAGMREILYLSIDLGVHVTKWCANCFIFNMYSEDFSLLFHVLED